MEVVPEEGGEEGMVCSACDLKMWRCFVICVIEVVMSVDDFVICDLKCGGDL